MKNYFATRWGIIGVGAFIGVIAALLQYWGNPGNMGICVACFERDITGHRAGVVQYMRPEIIGFVFGALAAALMFKEFRPRGSSAPIVRFLLGVFAMIGALVFPGCPWWAGTATPFGYSRLDCRCLDRHPISEKRLFPWPDP